MLRSLPVFVFGLLLGAPAFGQEKVAELIRQLDTGNEMAKIAAAATLADLGPEAAPAVPALVSALADKSEHVKLNASIALGKIGKPSVGPVAKLLSSMNTGERYYAVWTLGLIGPAAKDATPAVLQCLSDKDDGVRRKAAYAVGRIQPDAKTAIGPLVRALADGSTDVRQAAADALSKFGTDAAPALIAALKDDKLTHRLDIIRALGNIGEPAKDAIPELKTIFLGNDEKIAQEAGQALAKIGKASIPAVSEGLNHEFIVVRNRAVQTLGKIGVDAVPVLLDALANKNADVRQGAAAALAPMRISDKMVVLALAHNVTDPTLGVRTQALRALQMLGNGAKPAVPKVIDALKTDDGPTRTQALAVLANITDADKEIVPAVAELLKDPTVSVRQSALNVLGTQGRTALPHVLAALKDPEVAVRFVAVNALSRIPGDIKEALPALLPLTKQGAGFQRNQVVQVLSRMGEPAIPVLMELLKDNENFVRSSAVVALHNIGPDAKKATPALIDLALQDTTPNTRRNAVLAVAAIEPDKLGDLFARVKKHPNDQVRSTAYQALVQRFGKKGGATTIPAKLALPHLLDAARDSVASTRLVAAMGLGGMGAEAKEAIPVLEGLLKDADPRVRMQAQAALTQIRGS
jgi:HEAT repeat protein